MFDYSLIAYRLHEDLFAWHEVAEKSQFDTRKN